MKWKTTSLLGLFALFFLFTCQNNPASGEKTSKDQPAALSPEEHEALLDKGTEITTATFSALSSRLRNALQQEGVAGAVQYCNLVAYPLVDSLSQAHDATIRRVSLKVRNPKDKPTLAELAVLEAYHAKAKAGEPLLPTVRAGDATTAAYYAPILIQEACLQCHGKLGETLKEEDYATIKKLYPEDDAIGYQAGELRGMWSVTFRR